ncbi:MAG TPA: hypothetical protein VGH43_14725 [Jatrophihabitans sp.]|jgi:hypothetical protein
MRRNTRFLVIALVLLGLGWWVAPRSAPPLYDGVGFPDEPYRFVVTPAGAKPTKAPTTATRIVPVTKGTAGAASLASAEQAPQIAVLIPTGRLQAPAGTKQFTLRAAPVQPVQAPDGEYLWSNVYDLAGTDPKVTMRDGNPPATITLRAATAQRPYPTIERYLNGTWTKVKTVPVGQDIYQAELPSLGRYAVVGTSPLQLTTKQNTTYTGIIIAVASGLIVVVLVVIGVRRRSGRRLPEEEEVTK